MFSIGFIIRTIFVFVLCCFWFVRPSSSSPVFITTSSSINPEKDVTSELLPGRVLCPPLISVTAAMWKGVVKHLAWTNGVRAFSSGSRKERFEKVVKGLQNLKTSMNKVVVGHSKVKDGIILALVAQQHVYIEGPPGSAKTLLAETVANQTNSRFFFTQMHRDTASVTSLETKF